MRGFIRRHTSAFVLAGLVLTAGQVAEAAPWASVVRGFELFNTQVGWGKNHLGDGWEFVANSSWNNKRYDFGLADLTLTGVVNRDFNYTRRIMPAVDYSWQTGTTPLAYTFNINDGIQDLTATGSMGISSTGSINAMGFYDFQIQISNRGSYTTEGYGLEDSGTTDFDIGPINVTGNIFVDLLATITEPLFAATGQPNPFAKISGRAAKQVIDAAAQDAIRSKVAAGQLLSENEIEALIGTAMTASLYGDLAMGSTEIEALLGDLKSSDSANVEKTLGTVPEPATILLLGAAALTFWRRPRFAR